jgi:hypothetical protein
MMSQIATSPEATKMLFLQSQRKVIRSTPDDIGDDLIGDDDEPANEDESSSNNLHNAPSIIDSALNTLHALLEDRDNQLCEMLSILHTIHPARNHYLFSFTVLWQTLHL